MQKTGQVKATYFWPLDKPPHFLKPISLSVRCWSSVWVFLFLRVLRTLWGNPSYHCGIHSSFFLFLLTLLSLFHFPNICLHICHELIISATKLHRLSEKKGWTSTQPHGLHGSWIKPLAHPSLAISWHCHQQALWEGRDTTSWALLQSAGFPLWAVGPLIYSSI